MIKLFLSDICDNSSCRLAWFVCVIIGFWMLIIPLWYSGYNYIFSKIYPQPIVECGNTGSGREMFRIFAGKKLIAEIRTNALSFNVDGGDSKSPIQIDLWDKPLVHFISPATINGITLPIPKEMSYLGNGEWIKVQP